MKISFYFFALLTLFFTSCSDTSEGGSKTFWLDNPTSSPITVSIDENSYEVPANSGIDLKIGFGKHTLSYGDETINIMVKPNDQECIINPTLSNYVFHNEAYLVEGKEDDFTRDTERSARYFEYPLILDSNDTIKVPFKVIENTLFIEKHAYSWYFGLTEPYRNIVVHDISKIQQASVNKSKIFREKDFLEYIENLPEGFTLKSPKTKLSDLPAYEFIPSEAIEACPTLKDDLMKLRTKFESLETITDADRFRTLSLFELQEDLRQIYMKQSEEKFKNKGIPQIDPVCYNIIEKLSRAELPFGSMNAYIVE